MVMLMRTCSVGERRVGARLMARIIAWAAGGDHDAAKAFSLKAPYEPSGVWPFAPPHAPGRLPWDCTKAQARCLRERGGKAERRDITYCMLPGGGGVLSWAYEGAPVQPYSAAALCGVVHLSLHRPAAVEQFVARGGGGDRVAGSRGLVRGLCAVRSDVLVR